MADEKIRITVAAKGGTYDLTEAADFATADVADLLRTYAMSYGQKEVTPAVAAVPEVPAVLDEEGHEVTPAVPEVPAVPAVMADLIDDELWRLFAGDLVRSAIERISGVRLREKRAELEAELRAAPVEYTPVT